MITTNRVAPYTVKSQAEPSGCPSTSWNWYRNVDPSPMSFTASPKVPTRPLTGSIADAGQKAAVTKVVTQVEGVGTVDNQLKVLPAKAAKAALAKAASFDLAAVATNSR